jgi:outer membrane murein-binding lipoprotein Lpp
VNKPLAAVVLAASMLLTGCSGTPKMSVEESCAFLNKDTFVPSGNEQQKADQIAKHYQEVADKVAPEVAEPIQKMADVMKKVASTSLGSKSAEQTKALTEQNNRIGEVCK